MTLVYVRLGLYAVVSLAALQGFTLLVIRSPEPAMLFKEGGLLEWVHFSFVALSGLILLAHARDPHYGSVFRVLGLLALFAAVRELDDFLSHLLFDGVYNLINTCIAAACAYLVWSGPRRFADELAALSKTAPFYLILAGALIVVVCAQLIGQQEFWRAVMGDSYLRIVKRSIEEMIETVGYGFILIGSLETFFLEAARERVAAAPRGRAVRADRANLHLEGDEVSRKSAA